MKHAENETLREWRQGELESERFKNVWRTENYFLPLLERLFGSSPDRSSIHILSVGCGNGEDVDTFIEHGYRAQGIDTGYRSEEWARRKHKECFRAADARSLPFEDASFDMVVNIGVIEHVGAVGDTSEMEKDYLSQRQKFAEELVRVTKPGGYQLIAAANKTFPVDMWHGPFIFGARFHPPNEKFLPSYKEIKNLFCGKAGGRSIELLGLENFFQFQKSGKQLWVRLLLPLIKKALRTISRSDFLKASFLNPFLIVLVRKES